VVPFGVPPEPPPAGEEGGRAALPSLKSKDRVLLWNGGFWPWLDGETLLQAMASLRERRRDIKLVIMAGKKPGATSEIVLAGEALRERCRVLGLLDENVFLLDWIDYGERHRLLRDADLAVCTHKAGLETRFSFRTRFVDCLWSRLPLVITEGGIVSDWVERYELGFTAPAEDPEKLAEGFINLLDNPSKMAACRENLERLAPRFAWDETVRPLLSFLEKPVAAPPPNWAPDFPWDRLHRSLYYLRRHGVRGFLKHVKSYLERR
jgi:glycosyltransferase involved in cell wall biosynthesis